MRRVIAMMASGVILGLAPAAEAAFLSKQQAREFIKRAVPPAAPRVMLDAKRARFFHTAELWVAPARSCHRHSTEIVSCRIRARLVPDAAHRKRNWWPISCRGVVRVERRGKARTRGHQRDYTCRTVRPAR